METITLIARANGYYQEGTEVFNYEGNRFTLEEWNAWIPAGSALVRGINQNGDIDGELSALEEFDVIIEEIPRITLLNKCPFCESRNNPSMEYPIQHHNKLVKVLNPIIQELKGE